MTQTAARLILHRAVILAAALAWLVCTPGPLKASTVELPLFLRLQILQNVLQESLQPQIDGRTILYQEDPYNFLHISEAAFSIENGRTHFRCNAAAGAGFKPIGILPSAVAWSGSIDLNLFFYVDQDWQLRYRIADAAIYNQDGSKALVANFVLQLVKQYLYPVLEDFSFNLAMPRQEITNLIRACASPEDAEAVGRVLSTLRADDLRLESHGITVPLLLTIDQPPPEIPALPEQQPLSEEELETFQKIFEPLDAFLVFVIKTAGADFISHDQREQLFELLITSRHELLAILAGEIGVDPEDPLRLLFIEAWQQLKSIIEAGGSRNALMQEQLVRYMTFINGGDALLILDRAAPQLGMRITVDGLRQLARMLDPDFRGDPLYFDWQLDPGLRDLFLPPQPEKNPTTGEFLLNLLVGTAHASTKKTKNRLDSWVPARSELKEFTPLVARLLHSAALDRIRETGLDTSYAGMYQHLVPATALMESCWRQYVLEGEKIMFLRSKSGSIGMMQINQYVWRGLFDIERLKWDIVYNIETGSHILMHYFTDYGIKVAEKNGKPEHAARAAYSAYNGGPKAARRFLKKDPHPREKQVDDRLWGYYRGIAGGGSVNLATCNVDPAAP